MLSQRVYGIDLGYEDANDADRLRGDAKMRLLVAGDAAGEDMASQPSLSRFENAATGVGLYRMWMTLATKVFDYHCKRLGRGVRGITLDMDPTDTPNYRKSNEVRAVAKAKGKKPSKKQKKLECNRSLCDEQVFEKGTDKVTFIGIYRYAEFFMPESEIPEIVNNQEIEIEIEDFDNAGYWIEDWENQVKNTKLKKKIENMKNEGSLTASELDELGFVNTGGRYYLLVDGGDSTVTIR